MITGTDGEDDWVNVKLPPETLRAIRSMLKAIDTSQLMSPQVQANLRALSKTAMPEIAPETFEAVRSMQASISDTVAPLLQQVKVNSDLFASVTETVNSLRDVTANAAAQLTSLGNLAETIRQLLPDMPAFPTIDVSLLNRLGTEPLVPTMPVGGNVTFEGTLEPTVIRQEPLIAVDEKPIDPLLAALDVLGYLIAVTAGGMYLHDKQFANALMAYLGAVVALRDLIKRVAPLDK